MEISSSVEEMREMIYIIKLLITSSLQIFFILLTFVIGMLYIYSIRNFNYWKKRHVPGPKPLPFIGNIWDVCSLKYSLGDFFKNFYSSSDQPYLGFFIFDEPGLLIRSPEIIKDILVRNFNHFKDRTVALPKHDEVIANTLFAIKSPQWKDTRLKLSPVFSSFKLKSMFYMVKSTGESMVQFLKETPGNHEAKNICNNYSIDVIAKCFFGVDAHSFTDDNSQLTQTGKALFALTLRNGFSQTAYFFKTALVNLFRLDFFDQNLQKVFVNSFLSTVKRRQEMDFQANDFITTMTNISKEDPSFDQAKMAALGIQIFTAGYETTSSTIAFTLYELAINQDIQNKLRQEILMNIENSQNVSYDSLKEMKYLNKCIMETLRKYPPLPFLDRRCDVDHRIEETGLVIEKGTAIYIPISGIQNDEKYFPEPDLYNPDRFEDTVNGNLLSYVPFGYGPRACIGELFGLISTKLALIHVLCNFTVEKTPDTPIPIDFDPKCFTAQSKVGLPLKFKKILRLSPLQY